MKENSAMKSMDELSEDEFRARMTLMWLVLCINWEKQGLPVKVA